MVLATLPSSVLAKKDVAVAGTVVWSTFSWRGRRLWRPQPCQFATPGYMMVSTNLPAVCPAVLRYAGNGCCLPVEGRGTLCSHRWFPNKVKLWLKFPHETSHQGAFALPGEVWIKFHVNQVNVEFVFVLISFWILQIFSNVSLFHFESVDEEFHSVVTLQIGCNYKYFGEFKIKFKSLRSLILWPRQVWHVLKNRIGTLMPVYLAAVSF